MAHLPDTEHAIMSDGRDVVSNIGPDRYWRLKMWASTVGKSLGCQSALLVGSSLKSKDWRDLDVRFSFAEPEPWNRVAWVYSGDSWWAICAALSAHATSMVGATVDAQVTARPEDGFILWESS
jgi:hypothetical protein